MSLARCSGFWTVLLAVVHVSTAPLFYADSLRSILEAGVLGALDKDPELATLRGAAFWYVTVGLFLGLVGVMVLRAERRGEGAPRGFAGALAATGVWGVVLTPASGFWLFLPLAWLAWRSTARAHRGTEPAGLATRAP
ncbi:DUF6463 family protein [Antribacter gilvus]|uniref:DUF6463 family protein n=1 Tax=Antribacter gilvus TaxID=2304675 RepID=UPI000F78EB36|nr:DUF6463 family protein [Antribacter gilvus]